MKLLTLALLATLFAAGCDNGSDATATDAAPTGGDATTGADGGVADPDDGVPDPDAGPAADAEPTDPDAGTGQGVICKEGQEPRPANWGLESHCKGQDPDYDRVFDETVVHRFDLRVDADVHAAALADLTELLGAPGDRPRPGQGFSDQNPMWFEVEVEYDGRIWTHVGMRYKGNSSLQSVWSQGGQKLSFRFNFDKFEDDHPEIDNQRFYGFKKLTFSNGYKDDSLIRDKLAADLFRAGGVPAARGAFVQVHADFGDGPVYMGLYTMIEDPSDEMIGDQFGDDSGNLYKPDGTTAAWTSMDPNDFVKESNEDEADWSDVEAAIAALNASRDDAAAWRAAFETHFDVDAFLRYLAINQTIVNWDSYGFMTHNYYVYGDPAQDGRLVWFPWDLNEALIIGGGRGGDSSEVMLDGVSDNWPLIRFLLDDDVYRERYVGFLQIFLDETFGYEAVAALAQQHHDLIAPYVNGEIQTEAWPYSNLSRVGVFDGSLTTERDALLPHVEDRRAAVEAAITAESR